MLEVYTVDIVYTFCYDGGIEGDDRYVIFLTCDDDIENYLPEVRKEITRRIQNQIENLIGYLKKLA